MNTIRLIIGDWSDDGHGKTSTELISCNRTADELAAAFIIGCEKVGVKPHSWGEASFNDVARGDDSLPVELVKYFDLKDYLQDNGYREGYHTTGWSESEEILLPAWKKESLEYIARIGEKEYGIPYLVLWLAVAIEGDPGIKAVSVNDKIPELTIGGYGLFE